MDGGSFTLRWDDDSRSSSDFQGQGGGIISEEVIPALDTVNSHHYSMDGHQSHMNPDVIIPDTDQIAAENLIFLAQDIVGHINSYSDQGQHYSSDNFTVDQVDLDHAGEIECQVTEEVITDDWVQPGGQERVEVPLEQLALVNVEIHNEGNDIDVPLPTDQDEYTAMRPYPCDFCSRRFRKKANLMNHMVAHQNDRPYGCNLCGARYVRKCDLMNHLKVHAYVPDDGDEELIEEPPKRRSRKRSAQSSNAEKSSTYSDKTAVAARTQQYEGPVSGNSNAAASLRQRYEATDPSRPFVCQHCGVGFAREKALASHARIHGGDSPLECCVCGELCWSRENLISHTHSKHPHKSPQAFPVYEADATSEESLADDDEGSQSWVELICKDCGAGFQRADLLQRHTRAAHTHLKKEIDDVEKSKESENSTMEVVENWEGMEHACSVCGEHFRDALELLAHAESHARRNNRCMHCGEKFADNSMVTEHVISAHPNLPPNSCLFCGRTCNDQRGLNKHIASQHEIPPGKMLFCSKCGKHFHSKARLKRHMESHRDKGVTCNECGESFENGRSLMNHRHSHKGTAGRQFPCLECGKTFGSRSSQQIHIRIHTGERPYGCRFCWKAFADGGTLRKHERIHTGEKPYACAICPRAFNQRVVLREHVRSHHSGPDSRHGTGAAPYWCPVCDRLMTSSVELVHHIIQHCDNNTALKRQPQTGPRKYKRRRKLQQVDLKTSPTGPKNDSDHSLSESELPSSLMKKPVPVRKSRTDKRSISPLEDNNDSLQNTSKSSADSSAGGSARTKGKLKPKRAVEIPTRPKMIHTQRNKPSDASTTVTRRKGRSANALVTTCVPISDERIRPRTKNVTYHDGVGRLPAATFPSSVKPEPEGDINADLRAILKDPLTVEYVDEQSTIENLKSEPHEDENTNSYFSVKEETEETVTIEEDGPFRCEMCSESFGLHEELVTHVRVHI